MQSFWRTLALAAIAILAAVVLYQWPWRSRIIGYEPAGILKEVQPLRQLVTVRYSIQKVTGLTEEKDPVGSESILLIVQAHVLGGVDLSEMKDQDVRIGADHQVEIKLPSARILHLDLDEKNTKVWDRSKTWWAPWVPFDIDLEKKARLAALESVKQQALEMGILLEAQVNAQNLIRALLHPLGIDRVSFAQTHS